MPAEQYRSMTDEQLAKLTLDDPHALVELIQRYEQRLLAYIRRISGFSKEDAEDILQDAFLDAYRHIAEFDAGLKFSSWMYRIVHNKTISAYRKRRRAIGDASLDDEDYDFSHLLKSGDDVSRQAENSITSAMVKKVLSALPDRDREVLVLAYIEERSYEEIGDILRANTNTVATWIYRAKQKFQKAATDLGLQINLI